MTRSMAYPVSVSGRCSGCGDCVVECPLAALEVARLKD
jgi:ferredoxin